MAQHTVLDGDRALREKRGHSPQFSAHVCCGQTAGWIKMSLGTELGSPCYIVLDLDQAVTTERGIAASHFLAHVYSGQTVAHLSNC